MQKTYLAICHGYIKEGPISAPIGRHPLRRKIMTVRKDGKESLTDFKILKKDKGYSFVEASPYTGRTHQIRVHAKYLRSPVVGDSLYGPKKQVRERHLLHAYKISFTHPFTEEKIEVTAPSPSDFDTFWDSIK